LHAKARPRASCGRARLDQLRLSTRPGPKIWRSFRPARRCTRPRDFQNFAS